jgi:hypothetical protein
LPVIRTLARRVDARDFLELNIDETGPVVLPKGVSELESKYKQVIYFSKNSFSKSQYFNLFFFNRFQDY